MDTFKKRQKEMQRLDRQREKAARRIDRKLHPLSSIESDAPDDANPETAPETEAEDKPAAGPTNAG